MVPKLHKKGASFKGAAAYLLHDKGQAQSSERVAWTQARNLAIDDPHLAWRIMAATAIDKERLKQAAGVKATGRKSDLPVLHLTLSWHPDEQNRLSPQDMKSAADGAIRAIGAESHQALIIAHNDETHPHLHILVNRVNPHDGKMLASSKEKLNLSRWAEKYERERGRIFCEERVLNNQARERGEFTRGAKDQHRCIIEEIESGLRNSNDNRDQAREVRQRQKAIDRELAEKGRDQALAHRRQRQELSGGIIAAEQSAKHKAVQTKGRLPEGLRAAYRPAWREMESRHRTERSRFEQREATIVGRLKNITDAIGYRFKSGDKTNSAVVTPLFKVLASKGSRESALRGRQEQERSALLRQQKAKEKELAHHVSKAARYELARIREEFLTHGEKLSRSE